jgi:hypothetical protein
MMSEDSEYNLQEIDNLINMNKETIKDLERTQHKYLSNKDAIAASKGIMRSTENIRKLLRMRMKLIKENESYKPKEGAGNEPEQ